MDAKGWFIVGAATVVILFGLISSIKYLIERYMDGVDSDDSSEDESSDDWYI